MYRSWLRSAMAEQGNRERSLSHLWGMSGLKKIAGLSLLIVWYLVQKAWHASVDVNCTMPATQCSKMLGLGLYYPKRWDGFCFISFFLYRWPKYLRYQTVKFELLNLIFYISNFNSNKSPTRCNNFPVYYPDVYLQLNMFRAFSHPSSGPAGPTTNTARLSPQYEGKNRDCHWSHWAPDDGQENARNILSCK